MSKEAESWREQCSTELGRQLEIVVGSVANGIANIVQRNSYSSLLNERHYGSHLYQFFLLRNHRVMM